MTTESDKVSMKFRELSLKRSSIKGQITKFKNYLSSLESVQLSSIQIVELSLKLSKFEGLSSKFDDLQTEIEVLNHKNLDSEIDERDSIEQDIISCIATAKNVIEDANNQAEARRKSSDFSCHHPHNHNPEPAGFKLPRIEISKFNGAYFRWLEFRDTFQALVHNNERISDIHKFHYLISYLEGDAARIISNLEVSSSNYKEAWSLLCARYDNKRLLINYHLSELINMKPITNESERSLRFLADHVTKNLRALANLGRPTDKWDDIIIFLMTSKLDSHSLMKWEELQNTFDSADDLPTLIQFHKFLTDRAGVLEAINRGKTDGTNRVPREISRPSQSSQNQSHSNNKQQNNNFINKNNKSYVKSFISKQQSQNRINCVVCNESHKLYSCPTFKNKSVSERLADVQKYNLCHNCLREGHQAADCTLGPCVFKECNERHNSLLHQSRAVLSTNSAEVLSSFSEPYTDHVFLSTVVIEVSNPLTSVTEKVRALLDCGSQSSLITKALKQKLQLDTNQTNEINIIGIGNNLCHKVTESCKITLNSMNKPYSVTLTCLVLDELTGELPRAPINIKNFTLPDYIKLADPSFNVPAKADVILGADIFWDVVGSEQYSLGPKNPKLISSKFGWLVAGPMFSSYSKYIQCNLSSSSKGSYKSDSIANIDQNLTKFWEVEELPQKTSLSPIERLCEEHFIANTTRLSSGRFCVKLPLLDDPNTLGDSYDLAKIRLLNLEKRFRKNPELKTQYTEFINEYAKLGHLSESHIAKPKPSYFLCHHAVFKEESESTKIRVVFDGSAPTSSGRSLNDMLMVGPNKQNSLFSILIRARQYKFLLTGDVEKMFRQVMCHPDDQNLQLILWREDESQPIKTLKLNTVTYGTASASYLSTRCLWQVGEECGDKFIKSIIQNDFYVDDLITGSNNEEELHHIKESVSKALSSACFPLRKYKSNLTSILHDSTHIQQDKLIISESSSTLGLGWNPSTDNLHFQTKPLTVSGKLTKRIIMSNSLKIFDPLGLLSPSIIIPKIMLQKLWLLKLDWDDPVPQDIQESWDVFVNNLHYLATLQVPRYVNCDNAKFIEIHAFSDASQCAYGACVYVKTVNQNNEVSIKLLCAKSKVAPLKPVTIPRLELCAALLAARLTRAVCSAIRHQYSRVVHWCDSSVVLAWIHSVPRNLKTFVANRIGEITEITQPSSWRYVPTSENPADHISRGVNPSQLGTLSLWWDGPSFLYQDESGWPSLNLNMANKENLPEVKINLHTTVEQLINFENYSSFTKLQRVIAFVKRFINNSKNPHVKRTGFLTKEELNQSFHSLCFIAQQQTFSVEYKLLKQNKSLSAKSKILPLSPFIDDNDLIRVGGRIQASDFPYDRKHQILLDSSHHLTKLFFRKEHVRQMHAGPQLLLATVRDTIWPINGRHLARRTVHNCTTCRRVQGKTLQPKMGNLPAQRITVNFPFVSVGVDFAGPFFIVNRRGRGARLTKSYLCLFICMRYKCIHLEAVGGLSKDDFLMTLKRFIARRGKPAEIFSDNGRNFVAADKELGSFLKINNHLFSDFAAQEGIKFNFIPAYSPHFGGIWESGIKSAKHHVKRVIGNLHLTFEELQTLFAQVEAILNSRPLCPMTSNPNDFLPLSPGHFLIGRALTTFPYPQIEEVDPNKLKRFQRLEQIRQHFWRRWQNEYINELQRRQKWLKDTPQLKVDDLVLIKEENLPPLCWRLGRVTKLFPGPDGVIRVADVRTSTNCLRRALVRLCPLPGPEEEISIEREAFQRGEHGAA
ncbi:uncharacterized protein LOC124639368 [Helicoverpa zea]|uniref:uncharacterized protein LOC124639368 n=2 Tax=Helicoverpa zea TaxID=7113 RepID=UPI001F58F8E2|nr:uncharacterized protein LOC124639368 [Helicoverpa zea]